MSFSRCYILIVSFLLLTVGSGLAETSQPSRDDRNRVKLLSYIISKKLAKDHYSHKDINDQLSQTAFSIYMKQLDPQKRFFLQKDVDYLTEFSLLLDDQMNSGKIDFPQVAENLLNERITVVKKIVEDIIDAGFAFEKSDELETDAKKISFCVSESELKERWRKSLKYQVISRYLNMLEDEKGKEEIALNRKSDDAQKSKDVDKKKSKSELRSDAKEKILKSSRELFKRIIRRTDQDKFDRYLSIITKAFDPHSDFMPPTKKEDFDIHMRGSLEGIGAVLQEDEGYIKVVRIIPGGAASRQKELRSEDIILMVGQGPADPVDIVDMRIREAVRLIRGKKGTEVRLTVKKPDGIVKKINIIRDVVQLEETFVKSAILPKDDSDEIYGYIKIPSFYRDFQKTRHGGTGRNVTDDVLKNLKDLQGKNIKGLVVDLRNNGGGALVDAVKTAGLFIKNGPIVQVKTSSGKADVLYDYDPAIHYEGPLVVLLNKFSASASEIMAGALQDYNRAIIVGSEHSYGKGTVQTLFNLDDNMPFMSFNMNKYKPMGALKMTTQKFYRINGESTQHRGVVPDVVLPDRLKYIEAGEQYLENSLEWDAIEPISYSRWQDSVDLSGLLNSSEKRITVDEDFIKIVNESVEAKKRRDNTIVKVNINDLRYEIERIKELSKDKIPLLGHGVSSYNIKKDKKELSKEEQAEEFVKQLHEDPYVEESLALLSDIAS